MSLTSWHILPTTKNEQIWTDGLFILTSVELSHFEENVFARFPVEIENWNQNKLEIFVNDSGKLGKYSPAIVEQALVCAGQICVCWNIQFSGLQANKSWLFLNFQGHSALLHQSVNICRMQNWGYEIFLWEVF